MSYYDGDGSTETYSNPLVRHGASILGGTAGGFGGLRSYDALFYASKVGAIRQFCYQIVQDPKGVLGFLVPNISRLKETGEYVIRHSIETISTCASNYDILGELWDWVTTGNTPQVVDAGERVLHAVKINPWLAIPAAIVFLGVGAGVGAFAADRARQRFLV